MSLVGSLEDLGLGDILQIISLSGKSGVLHLRADLGEGRILFDQGRIRIAHTGPTAPTLASLGAGEAGPERLEEILRQQIEESVLCMFSWASGEFSFEVGDVAEHAGDTPCLDPGLNPQFLALEGTRLADERAAGMTPEVPEDKSTPPLSRVEAEPGLSFATDDEEPIATGEPLPDFEPIDANPVPGVELLESVGMADADPFESPEVLLAEPWLGAAPEGGAPPLLMDDPEEVPLAQAEFAVEAPLHPVSPAAAADLPRLPPLVLVDADLPVVEWARKSLPEGLPAAHLFQTTDQGVQRIRQYLRRAEPPLVVLSASLPADALSGARSLAELLERLQRQAPQMRILLLEETGRALPGPLERLGRHRARLSKPTPTQLADPRLADGCERLGREFGTGLLAACGVTTASADGAAIGELREISMRLRDSESGGEVLPQVLDFATRSFSRVGLFMIREEEAQGIAQVGLPLAGGPDDAAFRQVGFDVTGSSWLRKLVETRAPLRMALDGSSGDVDAEELLERLGTGRPTEAWLGPIVSANQVVAFLYADRLPGDEAIGDTAALEVVLHHAGLALDRAALERALDEPGP